MTRQLIDQSTGWVTLWILTFYVIFHGFSACSKLPFLATTSGPLRVIAGAQPTAWSQCTSGMFRGLEELHAGDPSRQVLRHGVAKTGMNGSLKSDIDVHRPFKNPHVWSIRGHGGAQTIREECFKPRGTNEPIILDANPAICTTWYKILLSDCVYHSASLYHCRKQITLSLKSFMFWKL